MYLSVLWEWRSLQNKTVDCALYNFLDHEYFFWIFNLILTRIYIVGRIRISYFLALSHMVRFYATTEQKLINSF
jgi:hypothetical protein